MKGTTASAVEEHLAFARRAAEYFAGHPDKSSFGELTPDSYLALRWGLGEDCVLVVRLHEWAEITNYHQLVREFDMPPKD